TEFRGEDAAAASRRCLMPGRQSRHRAGYCCSVELRADSVKLRVRLIALPQPPRTFGSSQRRAYPCPTATRRRGQVNISGWKLAIRQPRVAQRQRAARKEARNFNRRCTQMHADGTGVTPYTETRKLGTLFAKENECVEKSACVAKAA